MILVIATFVGAGWRRASTSSSRVNVWVSSVWVLLAGARSLGLVRLLVLLKLFVFVLRLVSRILLSSIGRRWVRVCSSADPLDLPGFISVAMWFGARATE